jgi:hypothetical protein
VTTPDLLHNLTVSFVLLSLSVFIQMAFTLFLLRIFSGFTAGRHHRHSYWMRSFMLTCMLFIVILDHLVQIHVWASAFYFLSYFPDFWSSQYFTAQTYTTLGYGNILLPPEHSLLAGLLALTGLLLIGWSTALFAYLIGKYHDAH